MKEAEVHVRGVGLLIYTKEKVYSIKSVTSFRYFGSLVLVVGDVEYNSMYKRSWAIFRYSSKDREKLDTFFKNEVVY